VKKERIEGEFTNIERNSKQCQSHKYENRDEYYQRKEQQHFSQQRLK
jgi:hypothetical protein